MGGFYGLKAAEPADLAALALLCPATEGTLLALLESSETPPCPEAETRWDREATRSYLESQDSLTLASSIGCPVLLVHARGDRQVPFAHTLALAACLRTDTTLVALEGGSHTTAQHDPAISAYTLRWLLEATKTAKSAKTAD